VIRESGDPQPASGMDRSAMPQGAMNRAPSDSAPVGARFIAPAGGALSPSTQHRQVKVRTGRDNRRPMLSRQATERIVTLLAPFALLLLWEGLVQARILDRRFFPAPSSIVGTFMQLASTTLPSHIMISLSRAAIGFLIGAVPAILVGVLMGLMPIVRAALQPIVGALFAIPKVSILPLVMLIFGLGEQSKWAIIAVAVFFQVLISTAAGVANIDRIYLDVGRNFGAGRLATLWTIALPGALPVIFAGIRLGWGVSLLLLVTAEMVAAKAGLGFLIWQSWQTFTIEEMYVGLVTIAVLGMISFWLLDLLEGWLIPWRRSQ
jgi:ABC-type nitrate/sulfonate/bicarbonate transport system permease component